MVIKKSDRYWTIVFFLSISSVCFSQTTPEVHRLLNQLGTNGNQELLAQEQVTELIEQGQRALMEGNYVDALTALHRAKDVAERLDDKAHLADALAKIGNVLRLQGNFSEALTHLQRSIDLSETRGDKKRLAPALNTAGIIYQAQGRRAKLEMWKQKRWQAPFYWAAFELQGEWK